MSSNKQHILAMTLLCDSIAVTVLYNNKKKNRLQRMDPVSTCLGSTRGLIQIKSAGSFLDKSKRELRILILFQ